MSRGYARVARALDNLDATAPRPGEASVVSIGPNLDIEEVRLAKDHLGVIHLLVALPAGRTKFQPPLSELLPTQWVDDGPDDEGRVFLDVVSTDPSLTPTFLSLVGELLMRTDETGNPCIDGLTQVLSSWREALARDKQRFSRQRTIGLYGELYVLTQLARQDPQRALHSWRGPAGYKHDFFIVNALEVKAYTGLNSPSVTIHGAYQLDPPAGGKLHLLALRLEESADGQTVRDLLGQLRSLGLTSNALTDASRDGAPVVSEDSLRLKVVEQRLFRVTDDFPGIRASTIGDGALEGVSNLTYSLLLDTCPGRIDSALLSTVLDSL